MRSLALVSVLVLVGCGSSASTDAEGAYTFGGTVSRAACTTDADCAPDEACTSSWSGELERRECAPRATSSSSSSSSSSSGAPPPTETDAAAPPPPPPPPPSSPDGGAGCSAKLTVTIAVKDVATCSYNSTVETASPAPLVYTCPGDGNAEVTFGKQTFRGTIAGGVLSVSNVETYGYVVPGTGITCQWISTQKIEGTLAAPPLAYTYSETLAPKQSPLCSIATAACARSGPVAVSP